MSSDVARVLSVTSGKGGVGKTHTTLNLGLAFTRAGKRVLVLDADLGLANVNIMLGFKPAATLQQVLAGTASLKDVIVSHPLGLDIIPASSGIPEMTNLSEQERLALVAAVDEIGSDYDYLLVDTAAGIGDNVLYFNVAAEEIVVVIDQEPTSITDAYAVIKVLATRHGRKNFSVIVNRAPANNDGRSIYAKLAQATDKFLNVNLKFIGAIPEDEAVVSAVVAQTPYLELFPSSKASLAVSKIARSLMADNTARTTAGGLQFFFKALIENS